MGGGVLKNNHVDSNRGCFPPPFSPFTPTVSHNGVSMTPGSYRTGCAHACLAQTGCNKESPLCWEALQVQRNRRQTLQTDLGVLCCPPLGRSQRERAARFWKFGEHVEASRLFHFIFLSLDKMSYFPNWRAPKDSKSIIGEQGSNTERAEPKSILMNNFSLLGKIKVFFSYGQVEFGLAFAQNDKNEKHKAKVSFMKS